MSRTNNISRLPKWAQEYIEQLQNDSAYWENQYKAVRVLLDGAEEVRPDVAPPESTIYGDLSKGYWPHRGKYSSRHRVEVACSSAVSHSIGLDDRTTSQRPRWLYSTKSLALKSLLHEVVQAYLEEIGDILKDIESQDNREVES